MKDNNGKTQKKSLLARFMQKLRRHRETTLGIPPQNGSENNHPAENERK